MAIRNFRAFTLPYGTSAVDLDDGEMEDVVDIRLDMVGDKDLCLLGGSDWKRCDLGPVLDEEIPRPGEGRCVEGTRREVRVI